MPIGPRPHCSSRGRWGLASSCGHGTPCPPTCTNPTHKGTSHCWTDPTGLGAAQSKASPQCPGVQAGTVGQAWPLLLMYDGNCMLEPATKEQKSDARQQNNQIDLACRASRVTVLQLSIWQLQSPVALVSSDYWCRLQLPAETVMFSLKVLDSNMPH